MSKNRFLKYFTVFVVSVLAILYIAFLTIPYFIKTDFIKPIVQDLVKQNSKLNLNYDELKFYTTPMLSAGAELKGINVTFDDNSSLFKADRIKAGLALPSILTLTAKTSRIYVDNPKINLEINENSEYKIVKLVEKIINENIKKPKENNVEEINLDNILKRTRIKVPYVKITNYDVEVIELKSKNKINLTSPELFLKYNGARNTLLVQTLSKLKSNNKDNIVADINVSIPTPKLDLTKKQKEEQDPDEEIKLSVLNIVQVYQKYDLKMNIKSHAKLLKAHDGSYWGAGYFDVDDLSLKLSTLRLPNSYFHSKLIRKNFIYDSDINFTDKEKIDLTGNLFYGKHPNFSADIQSTKIYIPSILTLLKATVESFGINNNIAQIKSKGYLEINSKIKTNFKKLNSSGCIVLKDGEIINSKNQIGMRNIFADVDFNNNSIIINKANMLLNNSNISLTGGIDNSSNANVKFSVNNLAVPLLYNAYMPNEVKKEYKINSAILNVDGLIQGKLDALNFDINSKVSNFNLTDRKNTFVVVNNNLLFNLKANKETIVGKLDNSGLKLSAPKAQSVVNIPTLSVDIDKNDIKINPFNLIYNSNSKINIKGDVKDYLDKLNLDLFIDGYISTADLIKTIGKEAAFYVSAKGNIPLKVKITGDKKKQDILAQVYADSKNYISPINLNTLKNKPSIIQSDIQIKNNKIKLKRTGLFKKANATFSNNLEQNMVGAIQLADLAVILENNHINLFRFNIPLELSGNIDKFKKSSFKTRGKILLNGDFSNISYGGELKISELNIPELLLKVKNVDLKFLSKALNINLKEINLNNSIVNSSLKVHLDDFNLIRISDLTAKSNYIDVDKVLEILPRLDNYIPKAQPTKTAKSTKQADIPVFAKGKFNIDKIKSAEIIVDNSKGDIIVKNNVLSIDKLSAKAFKGNVNGNINVNLLSQLISIKLKGQKLDCAETFLKAAATKDAISGTMAFETDISLKGATYEEQMKSLKGNVDFEIKDGQYGPFAKLENFFLAENVRENPFFKNTIGAILTPLITIDSTHFSELKGKLTFKDGFVHLNPITSQGDILCILIKGDMDLLKNNLNSNVKVRLASVVSDMLGPLAIANPVNLVKNAPGLNIATAQLFRFFAQVVPESEYKTIPDFSQKHSDANATKFQIVLKGDVAKPLKLVKSFKWLALQKDMDEAKAFSAKYVQEQEQALIQKKMDELQKKYEVDNKVKVLLEKTVKMDTTAPAVKEMLINEIVNKYKPKTNATTTLETTETVQSVIQEETPATESAQAE